MLTWSSYDSNGKVTQSINPIQSNPINQSINQTNQSIKPINQSNQSINQTNPTLI